MLHVNSFWRSLGTWGGLLLLCISPIARGAAIIASDMTQGAVYEVSAGGQKSLIASSLGQPHGVAVDVSGNVYVAEVDGDRISRIAPSGVRETFYTFDSPFDNPEGITFGPDGALYVSGTIDNPNVGQLKNVYRIDSGGHASVYAQVGLQECPALLFDPSGNLYVGDLYNDGTLWKVTPGKVVSPFVTGQGYIAGLAMDSGGTLFATTYVYNKVLKILPDGSTSTFATANTPWSIVFDPQGNLLVGGPGQITRFDSSGSGSVFASGFGEVRGLAVIPEPSSCCLFLTFAASGLLVRSRRACGVPR